MNENIVIAIFDVESEAYQAATELKNRPAGEDYVISELALVSKKDGRIVPADGFDTGIQTRNDTVHGFMIGGLVGILGGPLGMLLGASYGALLGSTFDAGDAVGNLSMLEMTATKLEEGDTAVIVHVIENKEDALDAALSRYKTLIARQDAEAVAAQVDEAMELQAELSRQAKAKLRADKKAALEKEYGSLESYNKVSGT